MVFAAHSSKLSEPLPLVSSLANALRLAARISSASILPSLFLSAREKRFSSRLFGLASGASSGCEASNRDAFAARARGALGRAGFSAALVCHKRNAPVRSRKHAAAPARKRAMRHLH